MKKLYLLIALLLVSPSCFAQEEIPLFDETPQNKPNLGRNAQPLDSLVLAPFPLDVSVNITDQKKQETPVRPINQQVQKAKTPSQSKTPDKVTVTTAPSTPQNPIALSKQEPSMDDYVQKLIAERKATIEQQKKEASSADESLLSQQNNLPSETPNSTVQDEIDSLIQQNEAPVNTMTGSITKVSEETSSTSTTTVSQTGTVTDETLMQTPDSLEGLFGELHDVRGFMIGPFALGLTPEETAEAALSAGYKLTKLEHGIPMFRTSYYEQNCRDAKIILPEEIRQCVRFQAKQDGVHFINSLTFANAGTKEYVQVLFSSPATDNLSYKIYYESKGDNSLGFTTKNMAKKLRRKEMFWNTMFETYGLPDDSEYIIWGDPLHSYMQATMQGSAYNAYIVLEDKDIQDLDYFSAEDTSADLVYRSPFTFQKDPLDLE